MSARDGDRIPRPERRGQVHHDAHDHVLGRQREASLTGGEAPPTCAAPAPRVAALPLRPGRSTLAAPPSPPHSRWPPATRSAGGGSRRCSPSPASRSRRTAGPEVLALVCPSGWYRRRPARRSVVCCSTSRNGLDPKGIRWIRNLLKNLAAQGRDGAGSTLT